MRALEALHWTVPAVVAVATSTLVGAGVLLSGFVMVVWLLTYAATQRSGRQRLTAEAAVRVLAVPTAATAVGVVVGLVGVPALRSSLAATAAATLVAAAATWMVGRLRGRARVLVVGDDAGVVQALNRWASSTEVEIVGLRALHQVPDETLGPELARQAVELGAGAVVVLPGARLGTQGVQRLAWELERTDVALRIQTDLDQVARHRIRLSTIDGVTTAEIAPSRAPSHVRAAKHALDRLAGAALLMVLSPVLLAVVIAVRLDTEGPAFFRQTRIGRDGKTFTLFKIRTMITDAEAVKRTLQAQDEGNGVLFKIHHDPRITRVGAFLRRTSLDELPQLLNVVRGEMSLVGPRPALPEEVARYDDRVRRRLSVRPGMTGLWQVSGRSDLDWEKSVSLDLTYADNVTLLGDIAICARTVRAVTSGRGAY